MPDGNLTEGEGCTTTETNEDFMARVDFEKKYRLRARQAGAHLPRELHGVMP